MKFNYYIRNKYNFISLYRKLAMENKICYSTSSEKEIDEISMLHFNELPNDFCSILGLNFLKLVYYPKIYSIKDNIIICAKLDDEIIGFISFLKNDNSLKEMFISNLFMFLKFAYKKFFDIFFVKYVFEIFILLYLRKNKKYEKYFELGYIAIKSKYHGKGIGSNLVNEGINILKKNQVEYCWVKTSSKTKNTVLFYEKLSFQVYNKFLGRIYLYKLLNN